MTSNGRPVARSTSDIAPTGETSMSSRAPKTTIISHRAATAPESSQAASGPTPLCNRVLESSCPRPESDAADDMESSLCFFLAGSGHTQELSSSEPASSHAMDSLSNGQCTGPYWMTLAPSIAIIRQSHGSTSTSKGSKLFFSKAKLSCFPICRCSHGTASHGIARTVRSNSSCDLLSEKKMISNFRPFARRALYCSSTRVLNCLMDLAPCMKKSPTRSQRAATDSMSSSVREGPAPRCNCAPPRGRIRPGAVPSRATCILNSCASLIA
mmetsp:Transcript_19258/g.53297  ORF Transcript_19258/g.53297 Transcript_19258/m.53297 type:complete len:269 (+) Transcript_19258:1011-1817(+)